MGSGRGATRRTQSQAQVLGELWDETREIGDTKLVVEEIRSGGAQGVSHQLHQKIIDGNVEVRKVIGEDGDYGDVTLIGRSFTPLQFLDLELQGSLHSAAISSDSIASLDDLSGQKTYYFDGYSDPEGLVLRCLNSGSDRGAIELELARASLGNANEYEEKVEALQRLAEFSQYLCTIEKTAARSIGSAILVMRNNAERYGELLSQRAESAGPARLENVKTVDF